MEIPSPSPFLFWGIEVRRNGFTIVELILVTLLLGILAALVPPLVPLSRQGLDAASRRVRNEIVYARQLAMMKGTNHGASFTAGGSYLLYEGTTATPIVDVVTKRLFPDDLSEFGNIFFVSGYQVEFDSMGRPVLGGGGAVALSNGTNTKTVSVVSNTGLVEVQ